MIPKLPIKPRSNCTGTLITVSSEFGGLQSAHAISMAKFDEWYAELEAWHKQVFEGAVTLHSYGDQVEWYTKKHERFLHSTVENKAVEAVLVNIQPIKEDTAEDLLREFLDRMRNTQTLSISEIAFALQGKALKLLESKK